MADALVIALASLTCGYGNAVRFPVFPGLNWGQAWASSGSSAVGVISGSTWGRDNFSESHGGNSRSRDGGEAGNSKQNNYGSFAEKNENHRKDSHFGLNWGQAWASGDSSAAGVISSSTWGEDNYSASHGGNSNQRKGNKGGSVSKTKYRRDVKDSIEN